MFVLHAMDPATTAPIERESLGRRVERNSDAWMREFQDLHDRRADLRATRLQRVDVAIKLFGPDATAGALASLIDEIA